MPSAVPGPDREDDQNVPNDAAFILYRGNLEPLIVPLAWVQARPGGTKPDLNRLAVADFGQTVPPGEYEAATDAILYEFDDAYRRRAKRREIERGEVKKLHARTVFILAKHLGVPAKQLSTY